MELKNEKRELQQQMETMGKDRDVTVVNKKGNETNIGKVGMNIEGLLKYKKSVEENQETARLDLIAMEQDLDVVHK